MQTMAAFLGLRARGPVDTSITIAQSPINSRPNRGGLDHTAPPCSSQGCSAICSFAPIKKKRDRKREREKQRLYFQKNKIKERSHKFIVFSKSALLDLRTSLAINLGAL